MTQDYANGFLDGYRKCQNDLAELQQSFKSETPISKVKCDRAEVKRSRKRAPVKSGT